MGEFPTIKQEELAKIIAKELGIDLPGMKTKEAYSQFISANMNAYKRERQRYVKG